MKNFEEKPTRVRTSMGLVNHIFYQMPFGLRLYPPHKDLFKPGQYTLCTDAGKILMSAAGGGFMLELSDLMTHLLETAPAASSGAETEQADKAA